jgi:hypothetical protein
VTERIERTRIGAVDGKAVRQQSTVGDMGAVSLFDVPVVRKDESK